MCQMGLVGMEHIYKRKTRHTKYFYSKNKFKFKFFFVYKYIHLVDRYIAQKARRYNFINWYVL